MHVRVQAVDSCVDGKCRQYYLDVEVIHTAYSKISGLPSIDSNSNTISTSNSNSSDLVRLDYGNYSDCSNEAVKNTTAECMSSCDPRAFSYAFEAEEQYVLYADALVSESSSDGGLQGIQASGVPCKEPAGAQTISRSVCGKPAVLGVSSGNRCSKNLQFPSKTYVSRLECACSDKEVCGAEKDAIVISCVTAGLFVLSFAGRWFCMCRRKAPTQP